MLRKLNIAIDCADDAERDKVQKILEEFSGLRLLKGSTMIEAYPWVKVHQNELMKLFHMVAHEGVKSLVSVAGGSLIAKMMRK